MSLPGSVGFRGPLGVQVCKYQGKCVVDARCGYVVAEVLDVDEAVVGGGVD